MPNHKLSRFRLLILLAASLPLLLGGTFLAPLTSSAEVKADRHSDLQEHLTYLFAFHQGYEVSVRAIAGHDGPYGFVLDEQGLSELEQILHQAQQQLLNQNRRDTLALLRRYYTKFEAYDLAVTKQVDVADMVWLRTEVLKSWLPEIDKWLEDISAQYPLVSDYRKEWESLKARFVAVDKNPPTEPGKVHEVLSAILHDYNEWETKLTVAITRKDVAAFNKYQEKLSHWVAFAQEYFEAETQDMSRAVKEGLPLVSEDLAYLEQYRPLLTQAQQALKARQYEQVEALLNQLDRDVFKRRVDLAIQFRSELQRQEAELTSWFDSVKSRLDELRSQGRDTHELDRAYAESFELYRQAVTASSVYCAPYDLCLGENGPLSAYSGYLAFAKYAELASQQDWWERALRQLEKPSKAAIVPLTRDRDGIPDAIPTSQYILDAGWVRPPSYSTAGYNSIHVRMVHDNRTGNGGPLNATIAGGDVHPMTYSDDGFLYSGNDDPGSGSMLSGGSGVENHLEVLKIGGPIGEFEPLPSPNNVYSGISQAKPQSVGVADPLGGHGSDDAWTYTNGITSVHGVLFLGHSGRYVDGETYSIYDGPGGYNGIAYSTDHGKTWKEPGIPSDLKAGHLVGMYFVQEAQDSSNSARPFNTAPGENAGSSRYIYALTHDKEFGGSFLRIGRVAVPEPWDNATSPEFIAKIENWEWFDGTAASPHWTNDAAAAVSIPGETQTEFMHQRIMYPSLNYDAAAGVYLLTFTRMNYAADEPVPWCKGEEDCTWRDGGGRTVIFESAKPYGPFRFVAQDSRNAQTMKYSVQVLTKEQGSIENSTGEQSLWVTHSGEYGKCLSPECAASKEDYGDYGTSFRRLKLTFNLRR